MNPLLYKAADDVFREVVGEYNVLEHLRPKNLLAEKELFMKGKKANPVFKYTPAPKDKIVKFLNKLEKLEFVDDVYGRLQKAKRDELIQSLSVGLLASHRDFPKEAAQLFALPSEEVVARAKKIIEKYKNRPKKAKKKVKFLLAHEAKDRILEYLVELGIEDTEVVIRKDAAVRMAVRKISKTILIRADAKFGPSGFEGVLAHEIGVHMLRGLNGRQQPILPLETGTAGSIGFEEGLAAVARKMVTENPYFASSAFMVVACDLAKSLSFRDTYDALRKIGATRESAWKYTYRVKRGLSDTSKPGAFPKDGHYLAGVFELEKYLQAGGTLRELYVGKVTSEDVAILKDQEGMKPAKFFPGFFIDAERKVLELIAKNA